MIKLALVCPCYNEESVLDDSMAKLTELLEDLIAKEKITPDSFVLFVNDGSKDSTWDIICRLHKENRFAKGLCFARNAGHQYAIYAGMMQCRSICDGVVTLDVDLQDELACIEQMVDAYSNGYDVVYGVKVERGADSVFKRFSAEAFYKLMQSMGVETIFNHADFRFLSKPVLDALADFPERNLYLRGLIPQIGFPSTTVNDHLQDRKAGTSKYTLKKMINLAVDGLTLSTQKPLLMIILAGVGCMAVATILLIVFLISGSLSSTTNWILLSLWLLGGMIVTAIGWTAVYVGKILDEVKHRPRYVISQRLL